MSHYDADIRDLAGIRACTEMNGFCLVRNVFNADEMQQLKAGMQLVDVAYGGDTPDIMSCPQLHWLLTDDRVLSVAHALLGEELVYYPESNVNFEVEAGASTLRPYNYLHCDALGMPEDLTRFWRSARDEIYRGYRFGLYFQDYGVHSGGLKVGIGTHKGDPDTSLRNGGIDEHNRVFVDIEPGLRAKFPAARMSLYDVPSRPGDLVVWNLRTIHSAGFRVLKSHPEISLHPRVEDELFAKRPDTLRPYAVPRLALFFDLAAPTQDIDLYIKARTRTVGLDSKSSLEHQRYDDVKISEKLKRHGISPRYDYLLVYQIMRLTDEPAESVIRRTLDLADRHCEFSEFFPLFNRKEYDAARGPNDWRAFEVVVDGVCKHSTVLRRDDPR